MEELRQKSAVMSFQLPKNIVSALREDSLKKKIHLNALANKVFQDYIEVHLPASQAKYAYFSKQLVRDLVSELPDETISAIATKTVSPEWGRWVLAMKRKLEPDSMMQALLKVTDYFGYACNDFSENGIRTLVLHHDMGMNFSKLAAAALKHSLENSGDSRVDYAIRDSMFSISFRYPSVLSINRSL